MNSAIIVIGLVLLAIGAAGINYITIPSINNIGHQVGDNLPHDNSTGAVVAHAGSAIVSGIVLWITTGFLIAILIAGVVVFIAGLSK